MQIEEGTVKTGNADWCRRAKELLSVPRSVVDTLANYTDDANSLYAWRNAIADLLDDSNPANAN